MQQPRKENLNLFISFLACVAAWIALLPQLKPDNNSSLQPSPVQTPERIEIHTPTRRLSCKIALFGDCDP
jgi:hypothetical protein